MAERHPDNQELRDYLEQLISLLDEHPDLRPCVYVYDGAFGQTYLHPTGWEGDFCKLSIAEIRSGDEATVWFEPPDEKSNPWSQDNYDRAEKEKVILIPVS